MWPVLLDMTKEESMQSLRNLELEAYAHLVSALRAQGPLNSDKRKLLQDTGEVLNITQDRHKAEIRRAVNDERLNTIAYHVTGVNESLDDWAQEGRRAVPLVPRTAPQTAYSALADEVAENVSQTNKQLPQPASTERKRPPVSLPIQTLPETNKPASFRVPDIPKNDDSKKRKIPICTESSSLAQHLLGPAKITRTQQFYRQRTKGNFMEKPIKIKPPFTPLVQTTNGPKMNLVPSVPTSLSGGEETIEQIQNEINSFTPVKSDPPSNENQAPRTKLAPPIKIKPGPSDVQKLLKVPPKKILTKPPNPLGQKVIVVSNAQTITNNSILQRTLSIPLKNFSVKNLEKFKIVSSTTSSPISVANTINSLKHKVVTMKPNQSKKVIPLSLINSKGGIKVLPIGGKIVGKTTTVTSTSSPLYIVNSGQKIVQVGTSDYVTGKENGKSTVLGDIMKASGVTSDDLTAVNNHVGEEKVESELCEETVVDVQNEESVHETIEVDVLEGASDTVILKNSDVSVNEDIGN